MLCIGITISISLALSISVLFISLMQPINVAQFLNATPLFLPSFCVFVYICVSVLPAGGPAFLVIVVVPFTRKHATL